MARGRIALGDAHVCKETKYRQQDADAGPDSEKPMEAGLFCDQANRYSRSTNHGEEYLNSPFA
jgi:hypothetical protein